MSCSYIVTLNRKCQIHVGSGGKSQTITIVMRILLLGTMHVEIFIDKNVFSSSVKGGGRKLQMYVTEPGLTNYHDYLHGL